MGPATNTDVFGRLLAPDPEHHDFITGDVLHQRTPNCSCNMQPTVTVIFNHIPICNISLLPAWVLAVIIGLYGRFKISRLGPSVPGSISYADTFFMYAMMITSGFVLHSLFLVECGAAPVTQPFVYVAITDSCLTSCIAISFIFNGLVDLRLISEKKLWISLVIYGVVFILEFSNVVNPSSLYTLSIAIACPTYLLCQLPILYHLNRVRPILYLMAAAITGGVSFLLFTEYICVLCTTLGAWSIEGVWYYGSDLAMFFILSYTCAVKKNLPAETCHSVTNKTPTLETKGATDTGDYSWIPESKRYYNKVLDDIQKIITDEGH